MIINSIVSNQTTKMPPLKTCSSKQAQVQMSATSNTLNATGIYNTSLVHFTGGRHGYATDETYRKELAKHLSCNPIDLKSVVGINELKYALKNELRPENFDPGQNSENIKKGLFRANLHIHTVFSDGTMTPQMILDKAAEYAEKIKKPVFITISDHNTLEGNKQALSIIAHNPNKYKNIRFVPGIEMRTQIHFNNPYPEEKPVYFEVHGYCTNPFNQELRELLDKNKPTKFNQMKMDDISKALKNDRSTLLSLAHPDRSKLDPRRTPEEFIQQFMHLGGKAVEAYYSYEQYPGCRQSSRITDYLKDHVDNLGLLKTGGRDSHENNIFHMMDCYMENETK